MKAPVAFILLLALLSVFTEAAAQNSSKSKSKDRFREKDNADNLITILNESALNGPQSDFAPAFYQNGIVFVSNREKGAQSPFFYNLYYSAFDPKGHPLSPEPYNTFDFNSIGDFGSITFSLDFNTVFYTSLHITGIDTESSIQWAKRNGERWESMGVLPCCPYQQRIYSGDPSISADKKRLYFSSNMPGGFGGFDIYWVNFDGQNWSAPTNAGTIVNTTGDETSPFIAQSGTLFFSSNGHNTLGGFDLFFASSTPQGFEEVINLGTPFNTSANDSDLIIDIAGEKGFFSSDRAPGSGKYDLYSFQVVKGLEGTDMPQVIPVEISVVDAATGESLQGAEIYLHKSETEDVTVQTHQGLKATGRPDLYSNAVGRAQCDLTRYKTYFLLVNLAGYSTADMLFFADRPESGKLTFKLHRLKPNIINTSTTPEKNSTNKIKNPFPNNLSEGTKIVLDEILFERDQAALDPNSLGQITTLIELMRQYPKMTIELTAHTDVRGAVRTNLKLSRARAKNAKVYLSDHGINAKRIKALGKGEKTPLNHCLEGVECTDPEHQQNNRLEVRIKRLGRP